VNVIGFLHTADAHIHIFDGLLKDVAPTVTAEELGDRLDVPVLRVDRPMAEQAVAGGGRVALVAAVEGELFGAGDQPCYLGRVAAHMRGLDADVAVLAQASMAPAVALLTGLAVPVLASPRPAVVRAVGYCSRRASPSMRPGYPGQCR